MSAGDKFICYFCKKKRNVKKFKIDVIIPIMKSVVDEHGQEKIIQVGIKNVGKACEAPKCMRKVRRIHELRQQREAANKQR